MKTTNHAHKLAQAYKTANRRESLNIYDVIGAAAALLVLTVLFVIGGYIETVINN